MPTIPITGTVTDSEGTTTNWTVNADVTEDPPDPPDPPTDPLTITNTSVTPQSAANNTMRHVVVTAAGGKPPYTFTLTSPGTAQSNATGEFDVMVTTTPPAAAAYPMSFNDPIFANVTNGSNGQNLAKGVNVTDKSWAAANNGNPIITMNGNNALTRCRFGLPVREGPRIGGSGYFNFDQCWIECQGSGDDHADCIQAYSPGSKGTLYLKNTTVRAHNDGVGSVGVFLADNWTGTFKCENVLFWSGMYGCRAFPDVGGDMHLDFKDVYFVGPWGFGPYSLGDSIGGHKTIVDRWENVRAATIQNGIVVPGNSYPAPA